MNAKQELFGIRIDALTMAEAVNRLRCWIEQPDERCHYVVTPNVDHTVLLRESGNLRNAYEQAEMILADGHPIVWASRLLGRPLPERVAGSELVPCLFDAFQKNPRPDGGKTLRVFLLGAAEGVGAKAATRMKSIWPDVETVGVYSPPLGFEHNPEESQAILKRIEEARPEVLVVGLGAPKQEIWVHRHRHLIRANVALCVGATIDFLAGEKKRAPRWMQRAGVEWLHRMCSEPQRLVKRYAKDAWIFPQIVWQQFQVNRRTQSV